MSENKRFELRFTGGDSFIIDNETHINDFIGFGDVTDDFECIVGLLNELHEENTRLEKQKQYLIDYMEVWCPKRFYNGILRAMKEIK